MPALRKNAMKEPVIEQEVMISEPIKSRRSVFERMVPLMWLASMALSFIVGSYWTKVKYLEQLAANPAPAAGTAQPAAVQVTKEQIRKVFSQNVISFGNPDAKLLLIEVADPSCPFCHAAAGHNPTLSKQMGAQFTLVADGGAYISPVQEMKKLVDSGKAAFAWIYSNGHGNGELATTVLYCAQDQGAFWKVHDKLMTSAGYDFMNNAPLKYEPTSLDTSKGLKKIVDADLGKYVNFVADTGINTKEMSDCLTSRKYVKRLIDEQSLATSLGTQGTPGFFLNERNFAGAYSWTDMKPVAEAAL